MDLATLSRRELQALCKSNGIPANKTNAYMVDALAKKRIPLSKMDANRDQKPVNSIGSPPFKSPTPLGRKNNSTDVSSTGPTQQKPPLFQNNFLRRGKRKDAPTSHDSDHETKPKVSHESDHERKPQVQNVSYSLDGLCTLSIDLSQGSPAAGASHLKNMKTATIASQVSTKEKVGSGLSSETLSGTATRESRQMSGNRSGTATKVSKVINGSATSSKDSASDGSKGKIEDRVRSQIDAAICSKVMKAPDALPSAPASVESSERALESNMKVDKVGRCEHLNSPVAPPEQQDDNLQVELANMEVVRLPVEYSEQRMESISFSQPLPCQIAAREENALTPTPAVKAVQRSASLELIAASPPISFSPLARQVEEKVRSMIERVQNFWKGSRDLAVVKSFGSPVQ